MYGFRVTPKVVTELLAGVIMSEGLMETEESILGSLTSPGCLQVVSVTQHMNISIRPLATGQLNPPELGISERKRMHTTETDATVPFIKLSWKLHIIIYTKSYWSHRPTLRQCRKGSHKV